MTINTAKTIIAILAVALVGSLFLNFNQESENRDLYKKIDQLVSLTKESQLDKEHLEFQNQRMERTMKDAAMQMDSDSLLKTVSPPISIPPANQQPTEGVNAYPPSSQQPVQQAPQATYPSSNSTPTFEDMNRKH